jgi:hypothetical protein
LVIFNYCPPITLAQEWFRQSLKTRRKGGGGYSKVLHKVLSFIKNERAAHENAHVSWERFQYV